MRDTFEEHGQDDFALADYYHNQPESGVELRAESGEEVKACGKAGVEACFHDKQLHAYQV